MLSNESVKKSKKKSSVWCHYEEMSVANRAKCVYCSLPISYSGGSSGNLKRHLRLKHPDVNETSQIKSDEDDCASKMIVIDGLEDIPDTEPAVFEITKDSNDDDNDVEEEILISAKEIKPLVGRSSNKNIVKRVILDKSRTTAQGDSKSKGNDSRSLSQPSTSYLRKHEYDFFGEYVSSALKTLPPENAISALAEIMEVISREKMDALLKTSSKME